MSVHTKGPWRVGDGSRQSYGYGHDAILCDLETGVPRVLAMLNPNFPELFEVNARLIAAAPKMLQTLKTIREVTDSEWVRQECNEAIQKAEGPPPPTPEREG